MNLEKDFNLFAKSKGISSSTLLRVNNSALPYVLEERRLNVQALDIYSRLLYDRIIYMGEEFTPESCNLIVTQLLYLNNLSNDPIDIYSFRGNELLFDFNFAMPITAIMKRAILAGCRCCNGSKMFEIHAYEQFKLFTGCEYKKI